MLILDSIAAEAKLCMQHKAGSCGAMADIFMEMAKYPDGFKDGPMSFYGRHPNIYLLGPGYCGNPEMEVGHNNTGKTLGFHKMYYDTLIKEIQRINGSSYLSIYVEYVFKKNNEYLFTFRAPLTHANNYHYHSWYYDSYSIVICVVIIFIIAVIIIFYSTLLINTTK